MYTIRIGYEAQVSDSEGGIVSSESVLSSLNGKKDNKANLYLWLSSKFDDLGVYGGNVRLVYENEGSRFLTEVLFYSHNQLSEEDLSLLADEVQSQLSDGYGEEPWFRKVGRDKFRIDLLKLGSREPASLKQKKGGPNIYMPYRSPLFTMLENGKLENIDELLNIKELSSRNKWGATPLISAIFHSHSDVARKMIMLGADVNDRGNKFENSPLRVAAGVGDLETIKLMVKKGAYVNERVRDDGSTALMRAATAGHEPVVEYFLKIGADVFIKNSHGKDVFSISSGKPALLELIQKRSKTLGYRIYRALRKFYEKYRKNEIKLQKYRTQI